MHDPMRRHTYGHASTLSPEAEYALGQLIAADVDASPMQRAITQAALRREDCARFARRLAHWQRAEPCPEQRCEVEYYAAELARAERDEAEALASLVRVCGADERFAIAAE